MQIAESEPDTLDEQRAELFKRMKSQLALSSEAMAKVQKIVEDSGYMGQGNPAVTKHPMTREQCRDARKKAGLAMYADDAICRARNMVPIYDPSAKESEESAKACIDQYEFPNIACEYPVVYARARQAAQLCAAVGKRLCDAHEWEGACAGAVRAPELEYPWGKSRMQMKWIHREKREIVWSYGTEKDHLKCATQSRKSPDCGGGGWKKCGSNTYPTGAFPACVSKFGVYDLHGNAAEHMNFPMKPEELASRGGYGETEMKGSWFIFARNDAHIDDCRWRAPDWHVSKVMDKESHRNYHLGFRCCKDLKPSKATQK